jgi:hypothetical protein
MGIFSQITARADQPTAAVHLRKRTNYTALACLILLAAVSYVGLNTQTASSSSQKPVSTTLTPQLNATKTNLDVGGGDTPQITQPIVNNSAQSTSATNDNNASMDITVNGQTIDVPDNGSISQTVPNPSGDGQTNISVSNTQSTTGSGRNYHFSSTHNSITSSTSTNSVDTTTEHNSP